MSAIVGYLCRGGDIAPERACAAMLAALAGFGPDASDLRSIDHVSFGRALHLVLPEDDHDRQPIAGGGGRYLLSADVRIDNRGELCGFLAISAAEAGRMSDADILLRVWERWQLGAVDRAVGDFAFAVWDSNGESLTLCRSPLSLKPLFYHRGSRFLAFASMPAGLHALQQIARRPDLEEIAQMLAGGIHAAAPRTMFEGIRAVPQGHAITFTAAGDRMQRVWDLNRPLLKVGTATEAGESLRSVFDLAVGSQLRRRNGQVASHLSAGRDSSAVAASAAQLLAATGEPMVALTSAPRLGFGDGADRHWLVDEGALAAATASRFDNLRHSICRPNGSSFAARLELLNRRHFGPLLNPVNLPWWSETNDAARRNGATVLLTGSTGNFSISVGGRVMLLDAFIEQGPSGWWRELRRSGGTSWSAWRNSVNMLVGPYLGKRLYRGLMTAAGRSVPGYSSLPLLRGPVRARAEQIRAERFADWRPPRSYRALVRDTLYGIDNAEKMSLAEWGIDVRDPTADRRVVELCMSLPSQLLLSPDGGRPAFEAAFADRIPAEVLANRKRGFQSADWFEVIRPNEVRAAFDKVARHSLVSDIVDLKAVSILIDAWPTRDGYRIETIESYCNQLLGTLSMASFIASNFPE